MSIIDILVQARTSNTKTGDIPTIIVGQNHNDILRSCQNSGCALLHTKLGGNGLYTKLGLKPCYAHNSTVSWGTRSILRALDKGTKTLEDYSLSEGFRMASRTAKYFRLSSIGDASSLSLSRIKEIVSEGTKNKLLPLGYTASASATHLQEICLFSAPTMKDADSAINKGWRVAVQIGTWNGNKTFTTPLGHKGIVCPEQTQAITQPNVTPRNKITCNTCGLCSKGNQHSTKYKAIGFISH